MPTTWMNEKAMRKGGVAEGGRNLPPPFHGPQQLETIYYHHGYPIVSISFMTNDIIYIFLYPLWLTYIYIFWFLKKWSVSFSDDRPCHIYLPAWKYLRFEYKDWTGILFRKKRQSIFFSHQTLIMTRAIAAADPNCFIILTKIYLRSKKKRKENQLMIGKSRVNDILDYVLEKKKLIWLKMNEIYFLLKILFKFWRFLI